MKALYLDGRDGLDVRLDGPALQARRPGRADGRFPLPRVARIIALGAVRWHPDALNACLRENKPLAVLDNQGRFVRVLFRPPANQYGLARHVGELLEVQRFRARYEEWLGMAEQAEMADAVRQLAIDRRSRPPDRTWQIVCFEQYRRWHIPMGSCYRYLLGLAAAQIASAYLQIGLPHNPQSWERQEYRLLFDMVRLERWRLTVLLEKLMEGKAGKPGRRELTAAFEGVSEKRDRRIAGWRRRALVAMMGIRADEDRMVRFEASCDQQRSFEFFAGISRQRCAAGSRTGKFGRSAFGPRETLYRVQVLRDYFERDRRMA